jgi:uncharacterized membrane protein
MLDTHVLLSSPLAIQIHILCAVPALILGLVALFRKSRDCWHRYAGRIWVVAMAGLAL